MEVIFFGFCMFILEFLRMYICIVGNVGWIFVEGVFRCCDNLGIEDRREYWVLCIFEKVEGIWYWC